MKNTCLVILFILTLSSLFSYTWNPYGPPGVSISKADWNIPAVVSSGRIGLFESGTWNYYEFLGGPNVLDFIRYDDNKLILILGTGNTTDASNSDGVYFFDLHDHSFDVIRFMAPSVLRYCSTDSLYYVGGNYGLYKTDGIHWTYIDTPGTGYVTDFAYRDNHFVISKNGETYLSPDAGSTWTQSQIGSSRNHFRFGENNILYAIMNVGSYSDG